MGELARSSALIALLRDGFLPEEDGGTVTLKGMVGVGTQLIPILPPERLAYEMVPRPCPPRRDRLGSRAALEEMAVGERKHADAYHADRDPKQAHHD